MSEQPLSEQEFIRLVENLRDDSYCHGFNDGRDDKECELESQCEVQERHDAVVTAYRRLGEQLQQKDKLAVESKDEYRALEAENAKLVEQLRESNNRHTRYLDAIGESLKAVRKYRESGEPLYSDRIEIEHLGAELREAQQQLNFNAKFADKLKEFGTIDRLIEEYSKYKNQARELEQQLDSVRKTAEQVIYEYPCYCEDPDLGREIGKLKQELAALRKVQ